MAERPVIVAEIWEEEEVTLNDVCRFCAVREERIITLVGEGIIEARGTSPAQWLFSSQSMLRARRALRIAEDFQIDMSAVGLVLDLLDEIEALKRTGGGTAS